MSEFVNTTLAALASPKQGLAAFTKSKQGAVQLRETQRCLVGSTKFTVSDSLLRHAVKAMMLPPNMLLAAARLAIPPFENMWIEWDSNLQRDLMKEEYEARGIAYNNDPTGGLSRVGYNIVMLQGLSMYNMYGISNDDGKIYYPAHGFYMSNEDVLDAEAFVKRRNSRNMTGHEFTPEDFRGQQITLGSAFLSQQYIKLFDSQKHAMTLVELSQRFALGTHQIGECFVPDVTVSTDTARMNQIVQGSLSMFSGDARLLLTLLALVNYPHHVFERKLDAGSPKIAYGRRVPRNEVRVLEIDLPKPRGVKKYERMFTDGKGSPRRQHVRRGHWRTYHHKDGRVTRRWIKEQIVGNASVGIIDHEYELVKKGTDR